MNLPFRVVDTLVKQAFEPDKHGRIFISFEPPTEVFIGPNGRLNLVEYNNRDGYEDIRIIDYSFRLQHIEFQHQVDCAKDKDGNQLWENDIVFDSYLREHCEIIWRRGAFCLLPLDKNAPLSQCLHDIAESRLTRVGNTLLTGDNK
ncbi:MAG: hypothetical protein JRI80_00375 [Deltaproteobacteria bacterium]|nr:hypothetical protein [Deltaproteobacteria bacterium]